jgi:integrase/recombinase XerD
MPNMEQKIEESYTITKRVRRLLMEAKESDIYTNNNKKLVIEFIDHCRAKNLSDHRICFYLDRIKRITKIHKKDFKQWQKKDVEFVMSRLREIGYSPWTLECIKATFKVLFRWIYGLDRTDPAPKLVRWLSKVNVPSKLRKEDLLTKKDVEDMLNATNNPMHKALLSVLWSGARPGEILGIRLKDITDRNGLIKIYVTGKTVKRTGERPIYIIDYISEFKSWIRRHPQKWNKESKLFLREKPDFNTPGKKDIRELKYANMDQILKRLALRAGIKKTINCYRFRHTAGTRYYGKYEGSYARRLMGHASGSKMEGIYCHLNEEDIEARLLGRKSIEDNDPDIPAFEKETQELVILGKAIKQLSEQRPDIIGSIDLDKLQEIVREG